MSEKLKLPEIGFGTWQMDDAKAKECVSQAIKDGYRLVDTAMRYHNEAGVGQGVEASGIDRAEVLVSTKLRGGDQGKDQTKRAFYASLRNLGLDYVDIYYIHWPLPRLGLYLESFEAILELKEKGLVKHAGVCNFPNKYLEEIHKRFDIYPEVNQFELHPGYPQLDWVKFCQERDIPVQGWGVIGRGRGLLEKPEVKQLAEKYDCSPASICVSWAKKRNISSIVKSTTRQRWQANLNNSNADLNDGEMEILDNLDFPRTSKDPEIDEEY